MLRDDSLKIFGGCIHPKLIYNRNTHEEMFVNCGECPACINQQANKQAMRVKDEILSHRYSYFFTLTYNNEFLPRFECISDKNGIPQFRPVGRCEFEFDSCPLNYVDPKDGFLRFDCDVEIPRIIGDAPSLQFGVCCKRDVQNFLKRLRKLIDNDIDINKNGKEKSIRYYVASEYGPTTLRPHYHGILFFDNEALATKIADYIVSAWSYRERIVGARNRFKTRPFADISRTRAYIKKCDPNTAFYVARYVSGNLDLPAVLRERASVPFHLSSKAPVIGCYKADRKEVLDNVADGTYRVGREIFNQKLGEFEHFDIPLNADVCHSLFRKCKGYCDLSFDEKFQLYSFYGRHFSEWREKLQVAFISWRYETCSFSANIADFLRSNVGWKYRQWMESNYTSEYYRLEMDLPQNWYSSRLAWKVVNTYSMYTYEPWLNPYVTYLRLFDKLLVMKFSDTMLNFYQLFNDLIEVQKMDFRTVMFGAYPMLYDFKNIPRIHPFYVVNGQEYMLPNNAYQRVFCGEMSDFYSFFTFGLLDGNKVDSKNFYASSYFERYVLQQRYKLDKCNKSKKIKNTEINGVRMID